MRRRDLAILAGLALLLCLTRWPLAPKYLFYFDSVNMAYALEDFSPSEHKPQPPGYPLYVGLCRLIHAAGASVEDTFIWSGILAGALTGWLLWRLGADSGRPRAGFLAALLFSCTPVFWYNSLTNQSRGFSAVASAGTAWLCWRAAQKGAHPAWLIGAFLFVGTLGGFRPVETLMLSPLLLWAMWKGRPQLRTLAMASLAGALPVAAWGWVLLAESGGFDAYVALMQRYSAEQQIFAAGSAASPWRILFKSLEWVGAMHLVAVLPWVWVLLWRRRRDNEAGIVQPPMHGHSLFVLAWLLPGLAFQVIGHAADPCHTLATIAATCWLGGLALDRLPGRTAWAGAALACLICAELFFSPLRGAARATSYHVIVRVNRDVDLALDSIRDAQRNGPVTVLIRDSLVTWRHIRYYFPSAVIWMQANGQQWSPSGATEFPSGDAAQRVAVFDRAGVHFGVDAPGAPSP